MSLELDKPPGDKGRPISAASPARAKRETACANCPLRPLPLFQSVTPVEQALIQDLKRGEIERAAGQSLITEGETDTPLMTLLSGWAFRFKTLRDGRRQILNFLLPGDFIGLQQKMTDAASHGVESLTKVRLCLFERDSVWKLHANCPSLGFDVTWLAAQEESLVDNNLLSVGRHNARERVAAVLLALYGRASVYEPDAATQGIAFPITQQHLADALGLSLVHTNKTLRKLVSAGLCEWSQARQRLRLPDRAALAKLADIELPAAPGTRPLI
ncbi:MAG: Crp/Fnr family transcriptional regulator [Ideonella sp.]